MRNLTTAFSVLLPSSVAVAQQGASEVPIEPTAGGGAVVVFGLIVVAMIVGFLIFMAKKVKKDKESAATGGK